MPLKVNVGYSQKLGRPDYGSIGASCHVECELNGGLGVDDPAAFHEQVRELYSACVQAVEAELTRRQGAPDASAARPKNGARKPATKRPENPEPPARNGDTNHRASDRQMDFLQQLCRQITGLGIRKLEALAQRVCRKPLAELSSLDASSLIDTLKAVKEGRMEASAVLTGERQ